MSLEDVAQLAGVSTATVSRVLNNIGVVKSTTRTRVLKAIKDLKYYPNVHARALAGGVNKTLGLIVSNLENPFFLDIFRVLEQEAHDHGYEVLVANTDYDSQWLNSSVRIMLGRRVAGLALVVSEIDRALLDELDERKVRSVVYDVGAPRRNILSIKSNYRKGTQRVAEYLRSLGHKRMAFVGHHTALGPLNDRKQAFVEVMQRYAPDIEFTTVADSDGYAGGRRAVQALFASGFKPSAILCVNDFMAVGVLRQLRDMGLDVPRDVSVAGFDNISLSEVLFPSLTTLHIPRDQIGRRIFESLTTQKPCLQEVMIEPELVVRESTGPRRGRLFNMKLIVVLAVFSVALCAQRKQDSPLDHLPKNMEVLTHFGERADFSPDNQRIAFMAKSFGDAFVIDLKTRVIRCLTCSIPGAAFLRIMHLSDGNFILIGPERFSDIATSRRRDNELWFLKKEPGSKPVKLGQKMSEGAAISKKNLRMAWSETDAQFPELPRDYSRLVVADVEYSGSGIKLVNKKTVYESKDASCRIESQDFYDNDTKMTFTCYRPKGLGGVMGVDLASGKVTDFSQAPNIYNEVEGIFPDGKYTLVESSKQVETLGGVHGPNEIDIWKLRLDSGGKDFVRVTNFNDYQGWKASNPVIATDGRTAAFQIARTSDEAGVGYGIVLLRLGK